MARNYGAKMIHISTDFVFSGKQNIPYEVYSKPEPINIYGSSKLAGEEAIKRFDNVMIIRTSWLYSNYGNNFFKTILKRITSNEKTMVVNDQIGTPTYAIDLADFIIDLIEEDKITNRIAHFSNNGCCSWYDFAKTIEILYKQQKPFSFNYNTNLIRPCSTCEYNICAKKILAIRPHYTVLSKKNTDEFYNKEIRHWIEALKECIEDSLSAPLLSE